VYRDKNRAVSVRTLYNGISISLSVIIISTYDYCLLLSGLFHAQAISPTHESRLASS